MKSYTEDTNSITESDVIKYTNKPDISPRSMMICIIDGEDTIKFPIVKFGSIHKFDADLQDVLKKNIFAESSFYIPIDFIGKNKINKAFNYDKKVFSDKKVKLELYINSVGSIFDKIASFEDISLCGISIDTITIEHDIQLLIGTGFNDECKSTILLRYRFKYSSSGLEI